jgi:hypothetical protein
MANNENHQDASSVRAPGGTASAPGSAHNGPARPRLGDPGDTWSTVLKDILREAPKTALVVLGSVFVGALNAIAYLLAVFVGYGAAAPPVGVPTRRVLEAVIGLFNS